MEEEITKDLRRVEAACKGRENYMNKLKENILNDAKKVAKVAMQAMKLPVPPKLPPRLPPALPALPPQDPVIFMSMTLVY